VSAPPKPGFTSFRQQLTTGDFIMENRVEDVNRDLALGNGAGAWQKTRVLYANLPDIVRADIKKDYESVKTTINELITKVKANNESKQSPYTAYVHQGKDINTAVLDLLLDFMQKFNESADKHNFRWTQKGTQPTGISNMKLLMEQTQGNGNGQA